MIASILFSPNVMSKIKALQIKVIKIRSRNNLARENEKSRQIGRIGVCKREIERETHTQ